MRDCSPQQPFLAIHPFLCSPEILLLTVSMPLGTVLGGGNGRSSGQWQGALHLNETATSGCEFYGISFPPLPKVCPPQTSPPDSQEFPKPELILYGTEGKVQVWSQRGELAEITASISETMQPIPLIFLQG